MYINNEHTHKQSHGRKTEDKLRLCTFTVWFQCNAHKYLQFHRINIQLTVILRQRNSRDENRRETKAEDRENG